MASYGNSVIATNVSLQRPMKMNYNTGLATGTAFPSGTTYTMEITETDVIVNGVVPGEQDAGYRAGLQRHAAYEIRFQQSAAATDTPSLQITIPGTAGSSAYKPSIEVMRTTGSQYGTTTGEDIYVVKDQENQYTILRSSRNSPGTGVQGELRVFVRFSANTDSLQPNS